MNIVETIIIISLAFGSICNCCRVPEGTIADKSPADGRYVVSIAGNPQNYEPGQRYNVSLSGIQAIQPQMHSFIGFMLSVELDKSDSKDTPDIHSSGAFELIDYLETKFSEKCRNVVTHTNTLAKSKIQVIWIAPPPGSGCVNFRATVIQHRDVWFMNDGYLTKQFCEEQLDDVDNQAPITERCCACNEAKYELTFEGKWSRHTHPKDFPPDNWSTKFSDIIGASHTVGYTFWKYGELASEGMREVAEHGSTRTLESELKDQSDKIRTIIKARGISYPNLTGKTFAVFRVDSKHHLISLVSMIHPSPDWIVGVSGLELCLSNCTWVEHKIHNLYPWDAGTDSGPSYNSPDQPQIPPDVIRRIKPNSPNDPRSPFYDPLGSAMKPIARLHISRRRLYEKKCENMDSNMDDPTECATTDWNKWSECNSNCGPGVMYRTREFKNRARAAYSKCKTETREEQKCIGHRCGGNIIPKPTPDFHQVSSHSSDNSPSLHAHLNMEAPECALSDWTDYSNCSNTCGKGIKTKTRNYLNHSSRKKCESIQKKILEINSVCEGTDCGGDIDFEEISGNENEEELTRPDCKLSEWSNWGPCTTTCGIGMQSRIRQGLEANTANDNPNSGNKCADLNQSEDRECFVSNCGQGPPNFCYENPVDGACRDNITSFWYYDYMSNYCALFFTGECQNNLNKFLSKAECEKTCMQEKQEDLMKIENLRLGKIDCIVSQWNPRPCNANCGDGFQIFTRKVLRSARYGGKPCPRKLVRVDKCYVRCANDYYSESFNRRNSANQQKNLNTQNRSTTEAPDVNGCRYGEWSNWSPCTPNCGENSIKQKSRVAFLNGNVKCRDRIRIENCPARQC